MTANYQLTATVGSCQHTANPCHATVTIKPAAGHQIAIEYPWKLAAKATGGAVVFAHSGTTSVALSDTSAQSRSPSQVSWDLALTASAPGTATVTGEVAGAMTAGDATAPFKEPFSFAVNVT